ANPDRERDPRRRSRLPVPTAGPGRHRSGEVMKTRRLGRTGLDVSPLGIGCYQLTGEFRVPRDEAARIFALAALSGVQLIDTAPSYGAGESEELVGRALAADPDWNPVVSTKLGRLDSTIVRTGGDDAYVDPELLERAVMHSL